MKDKNLIDFRIKSLLIHFRILQFVEMIIVLKLKPRTRWFVPFVISILLVGSVEPLSAQNKKFRPYKAKVIHLHGLPDVDGILYDVTDSSIVLTNSSSFKDFESSGYRSIAIEQIEKIKLQRKGKVWVSALIGAAGGAATGALVESFDDSNFTATAGFAAGGAVLGALIGTIVGAATRIKIRINGQKSQFKASQERLYRYSYKSRPIAP